MATFPCNSISSPSSLIIISCQTERLLTLTCPVKLYSTCKILFWTKLDTVLVLLFKNTFEKILNSHITDPWSFILNAELKAEPSYTVEMKRVVLHTHSPTIIKLQILCRSKDAPKERRHLWKISCYFPLHWGRRKKLLLFTKISRGKHEADCSLDKTAKLSIFVCIS